MWPGRGAAKVTSSQGAGFLSHPGVALFMKARGGLVPNGDDRGKAGVRHGGGIGRWAGGGSAAGGRL